MSKLDKARKEFYRDAYALYVSDEFFKQRRIATKF